MKQKSLLAMCVLVILAALGTMAFTPQSVSAASAPAVSLAPAISMAPAPQATRVPRTGQQVDQQLSFKLQQEQNWLERQKIHLTRAGQAAVRAQQLIDKAKAKGLDVSALESALATFNSQLSEAQASHDQAASILSAKAGFDANNQVTDAQTARQTLVSARDALRQAQLTLQNAVLHLRSALQDWRIQHKQS